MFFNNTNINKCILGAKEEGILFHTTIVETDKREKKGNI